MPRPRKQNNNGGNLGFEDQLWAAADALRNNMDAAEYKHVVLGRSHQFRLGHWWRNDLPGYSSTCPLRRVAY